MSRDDVMRKADGLMQQADAMEQKALDAWNDDPKNDLASEQEAAYHEAVTKANELRKQADALKAQASSAIVSIKQVK